MSELQEFRVNLDVYLLAPDAEAAASLVYDDTSVFTFRPNLEDKWNEVWVREAVVSERDSV